MKVKDIVRKSIAGYDDQVGLIVKNIDNDLVEVMWSTGKVEFYPKKFLRRLIIFDVFV